MFKVRTRCLCVIFLKIRRVDANESSILYKIKPEMASGKSSYVHLVAGG